MDDIYTRQTTKGVQVDKWGRINLNPLHCTHLTGSTKMFDVLCSLIQLQKGVSVPGGPMTQPIALDQ